MNASESSLDGERPQYVGGDRVAVLLPLPLVGTYDYRVPSGLALGPGDFVRVPLGSRETEGVVWGAATDAVEAAKLRLVLARLQAPTMTPASQAFVRWVAAYTLQPLGAVLRMAMSVPAALYPPKPIVFYAEAEGMRERRAPEFRPTAARIRVLQVLAEGPPRPLAELAREAATGTGVVKGLVAAGLLVAEPRVPQPSLDEPDWRRPGLALSAAQAEAAVALAAKVDGGTFSVTLLDGVPGSGKTEVYFAAVARALERGRQVLVLLPEIALGAQWLRRFRERFGVEPLAWHSDLTGAQRRAHWRLVAEGGARVVVGARSALFLPFPELGLIVVDEEHDFSFKQEDGVCYHARDMAVVRARLGDIPAVLVSATPSLETTVNVEHGRYARLALPDRHGGATLPRVELVDMRSGHPGRGRWLSTALVHALSRTWERGEQALLFLNRRGYAPLTLCQKCGRRLECPDCSAWLVEHRLLGRLLCHHCGYATTVPRHCPGCGAEESFAACGPGVERLAEEVATLYPDVRQVIATSDTLTGPRQAAELVSRVERHDVDLVVGTQILAKGHHFPLLTLVGVVDADLGLSGGDLRAAERTYQLLYQVSGRAGRAERPGRVLVQTYMPEHPVMQSLASGERDRFMAAEAEERRGAGMPPFGRLVGLVLSSRDEEAVDTAARTLGRRAPRADGVVVLGPAPAPLALLRGRHRRRLLLKAGRQVNVQSIVRRWLAFARAPKTVRVQVDVDPYSFL